MMKDPAETREIQKSHLLPSSQIQVIPFPDVEIQAKITHIVPLQKSVPKQSFFWLLVVLTGGIIYWLTWWLLPLKLCFRFKKSPISQASHLKVSTQFYTDIIILTKKPSLNGLLITFQYQHLEYYLQGDFFYPLIFEPETSFSHLLKYSSGHKDQGLISILSSLYGICQIIVPVVPLPILFLKELFNPFYIFQLCSCALWFWDQYTYYASAILFTTVVSLGLGLHQTRKNMNDIHKMALYQCPVSVFRGSDWTQISSKDLVPGDLFQIQTGISMPCDAIVVSGECVMEQGMLTGESVPVQKDSLPDFSDKIYQILHDRRYTLYEGTHVVQARGLVSAVVYRIGYQTMKGKLIRSILYPKPTKFEFYKDSLKFILVLTIIAIIGFLVILPVQLYQGVPKENLIDRSLDLITVSVPPVLPAAMTVGIVFAIFRLKQQGVTCISPPRVNVAGRIGIFVFDKTGTLTQDSMKLMGVHPVFQGKFLDFYDDPRNVEGQCQKIIFCMATCHSLTIINGEIRGDTQDLEIFKSTEWVYEEPFEFYDPAVKALVKDQTSLSQSLFDIEGNVVNIMSTGNQLGILHVYPFSSRLKRMGVIIKNFKEQNFQFYMKGAPEQVLKRCLPESVPKEIEQELSQFTRKGYRVLACAYRQIEETYQRFPKLQSIQDSLIFLGLIVLQNKLKPETTPVIQHLQKAKILAIIATGDAILTAITVGKQAGILPQNQNVCLGELQDQEIVWKILQPSQQPTQMASEPWNQFSFTDQIHLALTGQAFATLFSNFPPNSKERKFVIKHTLLYARMSPQHKTLLIQNLQQTGILIGMCGDGANDCGALKSADVGISLSQAETSVAAPFTSQEANIKCVLSVLKQGRCALVTSTHIFKFIALYSTIQFVTVCSLYAIGSNLSDFQFLAIDLYTILPLSVTMSYTKAYHKVSKRQPEQKLISVSILLSVIGQSFIQGAFQWLGVGILMAMPFYDPVNYKAGEDPLDYSLCQQNTVLFLISWYQYIAICLIFSIGKPWKKKASSNGYFMVTVGVLLISCLYCIVLPSGWPEDVVQIKVLPLYFRFVILGVCVGYTLMSYLFDKYLVPLVVRVNKQRNERKTTLQDVQAFSN